MDWLYELGVESSITLTSALGCVRPARGGSEFGRAAGLRRTAAQLGAWKDDGDVRSAVCAASDAADVAVEIGTRTGSGRACGVVDNKLDQTDRERSFTVWFVRCH